MPNIRIVPDVGEECTVTLAEFSRRVDPAAFSDILDQMMATWRARVSLTSGHDADAYWVSLAPTAAPAAQTTLPLREYIGEAQLVFELPGQIRVRAASHEEAHSIVTDVVRHQRQPPDGFEMVFDADAVTSKPYPALHVRDVHLIRLVEQRLLDNRPPAQGARS